MARGWHYTKLSLSSALYISGMCFVLSFLSFCPFCFVFMLSLELWRCSSDVYLSSRPRSTGLATTYITGYVCMVTHTARVWINRVRLPVLHVAS